MPFLIVLCIVLIVLAGTVVFNERDLEEVSFLVVDVATDKNDTGQQEGKPQELYVYEILESLSEEYHLSNREREVFCLLAKGRTAGYISEKLFISIGTVKTHTFNTYKKLGVHTQQELLDKIDEKHEAVLLPGTPNK